MTMMMMSTNTISAIKTAAANTVNNARRALFLLLPLAGALTLFSFLFSCNQDDIFFQVENETELKDPLIRGGPTKIVEYKGALYVASARIWKYKDKNWGQLPVQPGGLKVLDLAATDEYLYAVISTGVNLSDSAYLRAEKDASSDAIVDWKLISGPTGHPKPSAIYDAGDALFVGAASGDNYAVYALKDTDTDAAFEQVTTGELLGAAKLGSNYYISLDGQGVFKFADSASVINDTDLIGGSNDKGNFTGFIEVDSSLLMVSTSGYICKLSSSDIAIGTENSRSFNFAFTGAIAVWSDNKSNRRLLLGRKGSNTDYTGYGYYECLIGNLSDIAGLSLIEPDTTVESNATYRNSLGKHSVNSIYQAPDSIDSTMPIFASTQKDSLWACRNRVWNRQE
jgi:hypothetical protein